MTQFKEVLYYGIDVDRITAEMDAEARRRDLNRVGDRRRSPRRGPSRRALNGARSFEEGGRSFGLDEPHLPIAGIRVA